MCQIWSKAKMWSRIFVLLSKRESYCWYNKLTKCAVTVLLLTSKPLNWHCGCSSLNSWRLQPSKATGLLLLYYVAVLLARRVDANKRTVKTQFFSLIWPLYDSYFLSILLRKKEIIGHILMHCHMLKQPRYGSLVNLHSSLLLACFHSWIITENVKARVKSHFCSRISQTCPRGWH